MNYNTGKTNFSTNIVGKMKMHRPYMTCRLWFGPSCLDKDRSNAFLMKLWISSKS